MSEIATQALKKIIALKPEQIGDTIWMTGPRALFQAAQRIARDALKEERKAKRATSEQELDQP